MLGWADGSTDKDVAAREWVSQPTVGTWRIRFLELRLEGLDDEPRPGRVPSLTADQVENGVVDTLEPTPANALHWSRKSIGSRNAAAFVKCCRSAVLAGVATSGIGLRYGPGRC